MSSVQAEPMAPIDRQQVVLSVRNLSKSYGAVRALHNVSFDLLAGQILGLVGDNGAGKTTLVRCIAGIYQPDSGEILVDGVPRVGLTAESARSIGIETVHQNLSLVDMLDVARRPPLVPRGAPRP